MMRALGSSGGNGWKLFKAGRVSERLRVTKNIIYQYIKDSRSSAGLDEPTVNLANSADNTALSELAKATREGKGVP